MISEYFQLYELVPRDIFHQYQAHKLWMCFDTHLLVSADALRARYGPMLCNTWYWGGYYQFRGYRPPTCTQGADLSLHRIYRALDLEPLTVTAQEIRNDMKTHPEWDCFKYIRRVENAVNWLHIDRANIDNTQGIVFFNP